MTFEVPDGWNLVQTPRGDALVRTFDRRDFVGAVDFVNAITPAAESAGHHPDLRISWKDVEVTLFTHSEGRVTEKDFELAREIDRLA
jgi:4a-hydroxytetrahydrobiopterin dehydratase